MNNTTIIQGLDILDTIRSIRNHTKRLQAKTLDQLETCLEEDDFRTVRKIVLDNTNDLVRDIVKIIFGSVDVQ